VIYTDGSKIQTNVGAGIAYMSGRNSGEKSWNLGNSLEVFDAELFAIFQALKWTQSFDLRKTKDIWIFSDSQAAIQRLQNPKSGPGQHLMIKCHSHMHMLKSQGFTTHIHWIPSHKNIIGNEKADTAAQKGAEQKIKLCSERFTSISYMRRLIKAKALEKWENHWKLAKKGHTYTQMEAIPHWNQNQNLKNINRLQFSTFIQMKLGHGYFKSYLNRLPDYDSDKCHWPCHQRQTPEHLLTTCCHFKHEQLVLRRKLESLPPGIRTLFTIKEGIQAVLQFLKETKVGTRKWLLGEEEEGEID